MQKHIYLDNNATTPLDPRAFEVMRPYFFENFGNAMSSQHSFGWTAKSAIERAREQCASLIAAEPREIIFTSGATESIHLAILGFLECANAASTGAKHVITTAVEHKCVLEVVARAQKLGFEATVLPVNRFGQIDVEEFQNAIRPTTVLASIVHGNNEIGSINPVAAIGEVCTSNKIALHIDAAQSLGKVRIDVKAMKIDLLSASAHKIYGPKGAGFLFARHSSPRVRLAAYIVGGGQEKGLRGGTHNVPAIVGFGAACALAQADLDSEAALLSQMRDRLIEGLLSAAKTAGVGAELNGHPTDRLPNNVSITFSGLLPDEFTLAMPHVAYSSASACSSGEGGQSHVLAAIGRAESGTSLTVRLGLGRFTTSEEIDAALGAIKLALLKASRSAS